jgi:serine/threonine-protein kinase
MVIHRHHTIVLGLAAIALAFVVVSCGGGGGSPASPGPNGVPAYTVGGTLSGLPAGTTVTLQNNGADDLTLGANGSFTFATPVDQNSLYSVTVLTQPAIGVCTVTNGRGNVGHGAVSNVQVSCSSVAANTLGGTLMGLMAGDLVDLQYNGANDLTLAANGPFTFATPLAANTSYTVTVLIPPATGACAILNGAGVMAASAVSNVIVSCDTVTTLAGSGAAGRANGTGTAATFSAPAGVTVDAAGTVYVADSGNNQIRAITSAGVVTTYAGSGTAGATEGALTTAQFAAPAGVAVDAAGDLFVADTNNNKIRLISAASAVVSTFAGSGTAGATDATGAAASFNHPTGVAVDAAGNVYVADSGNNKIRKISATGVVTTLAGSGTAGAADGTGNQATFSAPSAVTVDALGNVYVADTNSNKIRMVTASGVVTTFAGSGAAGAVDATGIAASFSAPSAISIDIAGNLYVADRGNNKIRFVSATRVVSTWAGTGTAGALDATGASATFNQPQGVVADDLGNVYVGDTANNKIRKILP